MLRSLSRIFTVAALAVLLLQGAQAADHLDAPGLTSPGGDGRLDINDVYAFQSGSNEVLIMTVNPAAGVFSPLMLHPDADYDFEIDQDGDAKPDLTLRVNVGAPDPSTMQQSVRLRCMPARNCPSGADLADGVTGEAIPIAGGGTIQVDLFDDPFFFDLNAFLGSYPFCSAPGGAPGESGSDFFAGLNVSAIVIEIPASSLGGNVGVTATTNLDGQVDRMGRPAINTVFIPSDFKNAFNEGKPRRDAKDFSRFLGDFAPVLLPDVLTVDTANAAGFLNGRRLADDVIDIELQIITGNAAAGDCVDANDVPFSGAFPHLAPAN